MADKKAKRSQPQNKDAAGPAEGFDDVLRRMLATPPDHKTKKKIKKKPPSS